MSLESTILIYALTIASSSCAFYVAGKGEYKFTREIGFLVAIGITVMVAGVRYSIGTDYYTYIQGFENIKAGMNVRWSSLEFGYYYLNLLLVRLGFNAQSILFASSLITMSFLARALSLKRNVISVGFAALVFMLLFYQSTFNMVRLNLAVSIFLYNISNIENRKLFKFLFFSLLAASFHFSAFVTIPLFWLLPLHKESKRKYILLISICIVLIFFNPILEWILSTINFAGIDYYKNYIGSSGISASIAIKRTILYFPMLIPGFFMHKQCYEEFKNFYIYYLLSIAGVVITAFGTFQVLYVDRIALYFLISLVIVIPVYARVFLKSNKYIWLLATCLYLILFWVYVYFVAKDHGTVPYQWIL